LETLQTEWKPTGFSKASNFWNSTSAPTSVRIFLSLQITEQTSERSYYGPKKVKFVPFLDVQFKGSSFELVTHGKVWLNAQMGVSEFFVQPHSNCFCGVKDTMVEHDKPESRVGLLAPILQLTQHRTKVGVKSTAMGRWQ
jgi:hypothetical protein